MVIKLGKYRSFKGNIIEVISLAKDYKTNETIIIFKEINNTNQIWSISLSVWNQKFNYNNQPINLFSYIDNDTSPTKTIKTTDTNTNKNNIKLFLELFSGREDVVAKRWENNNKSGYSPYCNNDFKYNVCPKTDKIKISCRDCKYKSFIKLNEKIIENHLNGKIVIGTYPIFEDDSCRFLVFDFDNKDSSLYDDNNSNLLFKEVSALIKVSKANNIELAIERSRSGKGIHLWLFFKEKIPAITARKLGSRLITKAMNEYADISFKTYDRMLPNQDILINGGFGNLIALPFQKEAMQNNNSVFVNEKFEMYNDQWAYLKTIKTYSLTEIETFIDLLKDDFGLLYQSEQINLTNKRLPTINDFNTDNLIITKSNMLYFNKQDLSNFALIFLKRLSSFSNPEFYRNQASRISNYNTPRFICCFEENNEHLMLPRGLEEDIILLLEKIKQNFIINDLTFDKQKIDVRFTKELKKEQQIAANDLLKHNTGVLSATTAFGKTVVGIYLIAQIKANTLILVHSTTLQKQWIERLKEFLVIYDEPEIEYTPSGRKKKKQKVGALGGGKKQLNNIIDVVVYQSLINKDKIDELVKNYGLVIVDECHHVAAVNYEQVLKAVKAKYIYGLTATPTRSDGHHPIIFMQCGKIRHKVDAMTQSIVRPFEHYLIPRLTKFTMPFHLDDSEKRKLFNIYEQIQQNTHRNNLIINDIVNAIKQKRHPLILTERVEHVTILAKALANKVDKIITLTGDGKKSERTAMLNQIDELHDNETFVLIGTGKYIGEGFDMPKLDTLFLAMPIAWKGKVQQYIGRLHRLFNDKTEVVVYDYVDVLLPVLDNMYKKRLKSYANAGYKTKTDLNLITNEINAIYDINTFNDIFINDLINAKKSIIIVTPSLTKAKINQLLENNEVAKNLITIITKTINNYTDEKTIESHNHLLNNQIRIILKNYLYQRFAIIDQNIVWYGGINLLGDYDNEQSIMRLENIDIANELLASIK